MTLLEAFGITSIEDVCQQVRANHADYPRAERAKRRAKGRAQRAARKRQR
jgi:hypothetical protein